MTTDPDIRTGAPTEFDWSHRLPASNIEARWRVKVHRPGWGRNRQGASVHFTSREIAETYIAYQRQLTTLAGDVDWMTLDVRLARGGDRLKRWGHVWQWNIETGSTDLDGESSRAHPRCVPHAGT